ncbi:hypothetical protein [Tunicatimonas pelagia]|uniref:hypothetical protein n=1 Tax=Tunicatimonas pelagia TaxID=931531 RepID=UPI0026657204|nr:hypothetical protein [Tunicatimonas pelagia]WKN44236.1 hypothetical protein P0M28_04555 [Tunicatimonas pelagia]
MIDPKAEAEKILSQDFTWNLEAFNQASDKMKYHKEGDEWQKVFEEICKRWGNRSFYGEHDYNLMMTASHYAHGLRDLTREEMDEQARQNEEWDKENPNWQKADDTEENDLPFLGSNNICVFFHAKSLPYLQ